MDTPEALNKVLSRIQTFDPQNAPKIMGFILIQEHGDKNVIRLAHVPDARLLSIIDEAKAFLGLSSNASSSASTPSSPSLGPFYRPPLRVTIPQSEIRSSPWANGSPVFSRSPGSGLPGSSAPFSRSSGDPIGRLPVANESCDSPGFLPTEGTRLTLQHHSRGCSSDEVFTIDCNDGVWGPPVYDNRKFLHGSSADLAVKDDTSFDEFLRINALQQRRLSAASMLMASDGRYPLSYSDRLSNLNDSPRSGPVISDLLGGNSDGYSNPSSCQIYLTFPADSTFTEEDVSSYFSMYGPVQDVRIPFQQKRMFGFVTFVYADTVKLILAKGNPHFVCDSRVLVKPYKEMGKTSDKNRRQKLHHLDMGKSSTSLSSPGVDSREPLDIPFGPRMFHKSKEATLRRMLEHEAHLQKTIQLQSRRLMDLQLIDEMKNRGSINEFLPGSSSPILPLSRSPNHHIFSLNETAEINEKENDSGHENSGNKQHDSLDSSELHNRLQKFLN
ncbi:unnamed protein product [Cuscuta europaea]|uniref:RRM domain-containing protein n=1 Tax=Cuscuta europaea TaxID=41803 RepID=A0A9P0YPE7_CUSEU|nr:unnamed protein product [Cuscuta europaea]